MVNSTKKRQVDFAPSATNHTKEKKQNFPACYTFNIKF